MEQQYRPLLRRMEIADILDGVFRIYRHNFGVILGISAILYVPLAILNAALMVPYAQMLVSIPGDEVPWEALTAVGGLGLLLLVAYVVLVPLGYGAITVAVSERYLGRPATITGAYRAVLSQWHKYILTSLLVGLVIGGATLVGLVLCILPGIAVACLLGVWFLFFTPIIACEGRWSTDAMRRSKDLVDGHWWRIFGTWLLVGLIRGAVSFALAAPVQLGAMGLVFAVGEVPAQVVGQSLGTLVQMFVDPIMSIAIVLMYYDQRIRKEAFDLEVMAQEIGGGKYAPLPALAAPAAPLFAPPQEKLPPPSEPADYEPVEPAAEPPAEDTGPETPPLSWRSEDESPPLDEDNDTA